MRLLTFAATVCVASFISTAAVAEDCDEIEVLALNMYHEARGEGPDGMQMIAEVTLNRVDHPRYPDNICEVVYQRSQFSWTHLKRDHTPYETDVWEEVLEIAGQVLNEDIELFDNGATHFLNENAVRALPRWTREFEMVGRIGNHTFYEKPRG
jgi:N-acetylmuramoyl-L-alanine amidase